MDYFSLDKTEGLKRMLDHLGVTYRRGKTGWQSTHCPNKSAHSHGDRNPSFSVNLGRGKYNCFSCSIHGDWADLALEIEGWKIVEAATRLGLTGDNIETNEQQEYERGDTFLF
jgi:DNA primase